MNHTADGNYDITNKKLTNMAKGTASSDAVTKNQLDTKLSLSGGLMIANLDINSSRIYNVAQPNGDNQPATKIWSENKFLDKSSGVIVGPLNMSNNKKKINQWQQQMEIRWILNSSINIPYLGLESSITNFTLTMLI